ncbi:hypothetical protein ACFZBU_45880 [Embleya sp. NPDC008237]|uniref:hypothetical protein n=1 Tax=Embleya sp. NPDC008237 TaxID=3363978 RepID=UPI0036EFFB25
MTQRAQSTQPEAEPRKIDDIDWASLGHAYGSAEEVPALLRAIGSADTKERTTAFDEFHASVCHQNSVYDATAASIAFLVELAFVFAAKVGHGWLEPAGCIADLTTIARYPGLNVRTFTGPDGPARAQGAPSSLYAAQKRLTGGEEFTVVRRDKLRTASRRPMGAAV